MRQGFPWRNPGRHLAGGSRYKAQPTSRHGNSRCHVLEDCRWVTARLPTVGQPSLVLVPWKLHLYLAHLLRSGLWVIILALALPFSMF